MKKHYAFLFGFLILSSFAFAQYSQEKEITKSISEPDDFNICDLDNDGDNDILLVSDGVDKILWYKNVDGLGNFEMQTISVGIHSISSIYCCDLDNDGDLDILAASYRNDKIAWFENDGTGYFGALSIISNNTNGVVDIIGSDIDNDGDIDVISAWRFSDKIAWYENTNGQGDFGVENIITTEPNGLQAIEACDVDNDGDMDLLSASDSDDMIAWYENTDGMGNFSTTNIISNTADYAVHVSSADIDGDGDIDVLSASRFDDKIAWYENNGGIFINEHIVSTTADGATSVYGADINNDGYMDILSSSRTDHKITLYLNDGNNLFNNETIISNSEFSAQLVKAGDINGDGNLDIISTSYGLNKLVWFENDGSGNIINTHPISDSLLAPNDLFFTDLNNDGKQDIIVSFFGHYDGNTYYNSHIGWYTNDGEGNFTNYQIITDTPESPSLIYAFDINSDSHIDILSVSRTEDLIAWYENNGDGSFGGQQIISSNIDMPNDIEVFDVDNDGDPDVLTCSPVDGIIIWFENDGSGQFISENTISSNINYPFLIKTTDVDNDGDLDVITLGGELVWYENLGQSNFSAQQIISDPNDIIDYIHISDLDSDGDNDIITSAHDGFEIGWYENNGNNSFSAFQGISEFIEPIFVATVDYDDDGDMDIVTGINVGSQIILLENYGQENFVVVDTLHQKSSENIFAIDIDQDLDLDLFSYSNSFDRIFWFENYTFGAPASISGHVFLDLNQNGIKDSSEYYAGNSIINLDPNSLASYTNPDGEYWFAVDTGHFNITYATIPNWTLTTNSTEYSVHLTPNEPIADSLDFGFYPNDFITNINPELTASPFRCSFEAVYFLQYSNWGTTNPNGVVELILDDSITFVSSSIMPDSIVDQNIYWHFDSLNFFASEQIPVIVQIPDFNSMGDTLASVLNIYTTDSTGQFFFTDTLSEVLACSYDPNDKLVTPRGEGTEGVISKDEILEYTVRFQNTGNAEAVNVKIRDQIDMNLDIESIQIVASSHDVQAYIQQNRWLVFQFDSIMLPDSSSNEAESHGFVKFSITIDEAVLPNTQIFNTAHIYFDYNPAVITNTVMNTIECYMAPEMPVITQNDDILEANSTAELQWFFNGMLIQGATNPTYQFTENGDYSVVVFDENDCFTESEVYTVSDVGLDDVYKSSLSVYPNPTKDFVVIESDLEEVRTCTIYTIDGQLVKTIPFNRNSKHIISTKGWSKGLYIVKLGELSRKLLVE